MEGISVLNEILNEQTRFYNTYNQSASVIKLSSDHYKYLKRELNRDDDFSTIHGMKIKIDSVKQVKIEY